MFDEAFEKMKVKIKKYHQESTSKTKEDYQSIRQIEAPQNAVYYKISMHVIFTVVCESTYPLKLANAFIDTVITAFFD